MHQDLARTVRRMCKLRTKVIPMVLEALGTIPQRHEGDWSCWGQWLPFQSKVICKRTWVWPSGLSLPLEKKPPPLTHPGKMYIIALTCT